MSIMEHIVNLCAIELCKNQGNEVKKMSKRHDGGTCTLTRNLVTSTAIFAAKLGKLSRSQHTVYTFL